MNSKLLYLPLKELHEYMSNLEIENERLRNELAHMSRLNCILENIRRSSGKGFTAMQSVDRNKCCRCNEHLNVHLRRAAQEAEIERMVWEEQYDKLFHSTIMSKHEPLIQINDDSVASLHSSRSSNDCGSCDEPMTTEEDSEHESIASRHNSTSSTEQRPYSRSTTRSTSNDVDDNSNKEDNTTKSDDTLPHYSDSDSGYDSSPVMVVYDSTKTLACDWPNCHQVFSNEEVLMHHRRNHIRKSKYHCEFCSARLLNKEDLEAHIAKHLNVKIKEEEEEEEDTSSESSITPPPPLNRADDALKAKQNSIESHLNNRLSDANAFGDEFSKLNRMDGFSFHSSLNANNARNAKVAPNNYSVDGIAGNSLRPEEYKRTRYSGVGRYRCPWPDCGYTPHFLRDLRRHMHKHTGDKKHKCDYPGCDFVSVWKTSLLQHQRKKHLAVIATNETISRA